jgi:hypothetical protein
VQGLQLLQALQPAAELLGIAAVWLLLLLLLACILL